jgi:hypothetical protein
MLLAIVTSCVRCGSPKAAGWAIGRAILQLPPGRDTRQSPPTKLRKMPISVLGKGSNTG